jgi:hypothetical protein
MDEMPGKSLAPTTLMEMLSLFRFYRDETGLDGILQDLDLEKVTPYQIYFAVHNRPPDSLEAVQADQHFSIRDIFVGKLRSEEFQNTLARNLFAALPDKKRLFFVHIPGCASAALSTHLMGRYPALHAAILDRSVTSEAKFFHAVKDLMLELAVSDTLFLHGNIALRTYEAWGGLRFGDRIFTVLRNPIERVIAQINDILARVYAAGDSPTPDTVTWRAALGLAPNPPAPSVLEAKDLAQRILQHEGFLTQGGMTGFLGGGSASLALEMLVTRNVEVTDLPRLGAWGREAWGIDGLEHHAETPAFVTFDDLSTADQGLLAEMTREDAELYRLVASRLDSTGQSSLTGRALLAPERVQVPVSAPAVTQVQAEPSEPISPAELMLGFESLGENCEFGLVQRRCEAEPLGLLRFSSAPLPKLMKALREGFIGLGEADNVRVELSSNGREYMVADQKFGFYSHAWVLAGGKTPEEVHERETKRLPFLRRKLIEDFAEGEKIFVYHSLDPMTEFDAQTLAKAVHAYGPTTLLWVTLANDDHPPGSAIWIEPGLLRGYMDRFAPGENAHDLSLECWVQLCRAARALVGAIAK